MAKFLMYQNIALRISEINEIEIRKVGNGWITNIQLSGGKQWGIPSCDEPLPISGVMEMLEIAESYDKYSVEWDDLLQTC